MALRVSDHAIVRVLQRRFGMRRELELARQWILQQIELPHRALGDGRFPCLGGGHAVVQHNTVVTYVEDEVEEQEEERTTKVIGLADRATREWRTTHAELLRQLADEIETGRVQHCLVAAVGEDGAAWHSRMIDQVPRARELYGLVAQLSHNILYEVAHAD